MSGSTTNNLFLTNNYSIVSKYSAVKNGYFSDKNLENFLENQPAIKSWRRTPLVNRGYAARLLAIDWIVKRSIKFEAVDCFIILGAGYDTLSFQKQEKQCCYIEIDLPQVVSIKSKYIKENKVLDGEDLIEIEEGIFSSTFSSYHLVACDLRDTLRLAKILCSILPKVPGIKNVAILNEVCLCYLEFEENKTVLKTIIDSLKNSAFKVHYIGFEQVKPFEDSQMSKVMLDHFSSLGYPLRYFPSPKTIKTLFVDSLNFNHVTVSSMYQIYHNALFGVRQEIEAFRREPFDEFEEMDLYLSHYALVTGALILIDPFMASNINTTFKSSADELNSYFENLMIEQDNRINLIDSVISRFAHTSCVYEEDNSGAYSLLVTGGFGKPEDGSSSATTSQQHKRLNDCTMLSDRGRGIEHTTLGLDKFPIEKICLDRMHGQVGKVNSNLIFFNGGRQSPLKQKPCNIPFLASITDNSLMLEYEFSGADSILAWRHKISDINGDELYQVGGVRDQSSQPLVIWNFSSSKLGFREEVSSFPEVFERHSCDIDMRDSSTMLIFGGLKTTECFLDKPVDPEYSAVLWDRRSSQPIQLDIDTPSRCYGSNIHFISENQFLKIGGVSTINGLENVVELIDLRNSRSIPILKKFGDSRHMIMINTSTCKLEKSSKILSIGGGGNYFTFGTCFNEYHLEYSYS